MNILEIYTAKQTGLISEPIDKISWLWVFNPIAGLRTPTSNADLDLTDIIENKFVVTVYWPNSSRIAAITSYYKNKKHGIRKMYDVRGNLRVICNFKHEVLHGKELYLRSGPRRPICLKIYDHGKLTSETHWDKHKKHYKKEYDSDGKLLRTIHYLEETDDTNNQE